MTPKQNKKQVEIERKILDMKLEYQKRENERVDKLNKMIWDYAKRADTIPSYPIQPYIIL